jgi:hypothetical protein
MMSPWLTRIPLRMPGRESTQVPVMRRETPLMAHDNQVAIATLPADELDDTVACRLHPSADRRTVVNPFVRTPGLQYRVKTGVLKSRK